MNLALRRYKKQHNRHFKQCLYDVSYLNGLYGVLACVVGIASSFCITLIPRSNILTRPDSWYEIISPFVFSGILCAAFVAIRAEAIFNPFDTKTLIVVAKLSISFVITATAMIFGIHLIWSTILGYFEPFPFKCPLIVYLGYFAFVMTLLNVIPSQKRKIPKFRKQYKAYVYYLLWSVLIVAIQLILLSKLFDSVPLDLQWLLAFVVQINKAFNERIIDILMAKAAIPEKTIDAKFIGKITNNIAYSFWLAITLATTATEVTAHVLLGINFAINLKLCSRVLNFGKTVSSTNSYAKTKASVRRLAITELILNESIDIMAAIIFLGSFTMAYFGPNYSIIGNVGCSIWTFKKIDYLPDLFQPVVQMALFDFGSVVLVGSLLWNYCGINVFHEYCKAMKKYWIFLAIGGSVYTNAVSIIN